MKSLAASAVVMMLLTGCTTRPLVGGVVLCVAANCEINMKPDTASGAEKAGAGIAQYLAERFSNRGR
jgi:hypothetical protein